MKKKEYIEKLSQLIFNKIKYHAPNLTSENVDYEILKVLNIDTSLPVFIFKKPLNKIFFSAFKKAKKTCQFNLILTKKSEVAEKKVVKLPNTFLLPEEEVGLSFYNNLDALNINYPSSSNFKVKYKEPFLAINDKEIELQFQPYYLGKKFQENGIIVDIKEFLCNGKNFLICLANTHTCCEEIKVELNLPLPRGYYFFSKTKNCIQIKNLTNKDIAYFNYYCKDAKFTFSNVDGIEFSSFACINFETKIKLMPKEQKKIYFNFGDEKYCLYNSLEMIEFFNMSQEKMFEIFDLKIKTKDSDFDYNFNRYLPEKIWENWQKNTHDEESEKNWLKIKNSIVKKCEKGEQIQENFKGLKEVYMYRNQRWKRIFILRNGARYMYADNTKYFNFFLLTKEIFKKNNEIYLSFDK